MAFESVRSYVQLANGLGELTMAKAMEAAQGLLVLPGADEVSRKVVQASTLAEELLEMARANRANLVALVQSEVESALRRTDVARVADLDAARTALAGVSKELADLKAMVVATGASAVAGASRGSLGRSGAVTTSVRTVTSPPAETPAPRPARTAPATSTAKAPAKKAAPRKAAARPATSATKETTAKKAAAKKATAKKATAKNSTAKKATAKKATAKKATAKPTTKKAAAKTTSTANETTS
ncbi:hypothetical protein ABEG17_19355 [Pedococcus sp. KACC 23699]|uniref:Phasin domain-containing protein n=1 Tax=Pedococcus sp. KACC 23699 TaxID=3149228 RepID=A0AAU7JTV6_9MICO